MTGSHPTVQSNTGAAGLTLVVSRDVANRAREFGRTFNTERLFAQLHADNHARLVQRVLEGRVQHGPRHGWCAACHYSPLDPNSRECDWCGEDAVVTSDREQMLYAAQQDCVWRVPADPFFGDFPR